MLNKPLHFLLQTKRGYHSGSRGWPGSLSEFRWPTGHLGLGFTASKVMQTLQDSRWGEGRGACGWFRVP